MLALTIYSKIESLPEHLQQQVANFVDFLLSTAEVKEGEKKSPKPRPKFGSAKGTFVMADDFEAPLEDFKEYMNP